ncbi:MAG: hypothetical protein U1E39_16070 [Planctomycetota bacterium]
MRRQAGEVRNPPKARRASLAPVGWLMAILFVVAGGPRAADGGDAELASFLVQGAREDLAKKRYDDALKKLAKARVEDPACLEASYWTGVVHDARKDPRGALTAYQAFMTGYREKQAGGTASKDEDALATKASARLDVLAASQTELGRLRDDYVRQLYAFAEENFVRDPAVTTRALRLLLEADPKHVAARKLLEKLGVAEAAEVAADSDPFGIRVWEDLIGSRLFAEGDGFEFGEGTMAFERSVGQAMTPRQMDRTTPRFVLDAEFRFVRESNDRVFGMVFGSVGNRMYMAMVCPQKVDLVFVERGGRSTQIFASKMLDVPAEVDRWMRATVVVDGPKIEVQLDGKTMLETDRIQHSDLDGIIGVYAQQTRVELRRYRLGRRP